MENTELIEKVAHLDEREKSNTKRLNEHDIKFKEQDNKIEELSNVYIALTKVDNKVDNLDGKFGNMESDVSEIKSDLKEMKEKPLKEYENTKSQIKKQVISFFVGIALTALAFYLGLSKFL